MDIFLRLAADPGAWAALATLIAMEVVLGLDNLVFIALLLEPHRRTPAGPGARPRPVAGASVPLGAARLGVVGGAADGAAGDGLRARLFRARPACCWRAACSWSGRRRRRSTIGSTRTTRATARRPASPLSLAAGLIQIILIDIVFSVDSIITAVGMTDHFPIMVAAVVVSVGVMMAASGPLGAFIHRNPTVLMLALSFLLMIGMTLIADGFGFHIERGYIYAAMFFSSLVEALNALARRKVRRTT